MNEEAFVDSQEPAGNAENTSTTWGAERGKASAKTETTKASASTIMAESYPRDGPWDTVSTGELIQDTFTLIVGSSTREREPSAWKSILAAVFERLMLERAPRVQAKQMDEVRV